MRDRAVLVVPFACAALAGCAPERLAAQAVPTELTQYQHDVWRAENGLPGNLIFAIRQSTDGYLWLSTLSGLARFDGVRFTVFDRTNTPAFRDASFPTLPLLVDRRGAMWIGMGAGLVQYRDGAFGRVLIRGGWPLSVVTLMAEDGTGAYWMVEGRLEGSPVYVLRDGRVAPARTTPQLPEDAIIVVGRARGGVWVGTKSHGLIRVVDGVATTMAAAGALPHPRITHLFEGRDGTVWIGTQSGFARLHGEELTSHPLATGTMNGYVTAFAEDGNGSVWVGTTGHGLLRWHGGHVAGYAAADARSRAQVLALCVDREGSLWVGTQHGLERLRAAPFATLSTADGGPADQPGALLWDDAGELWVAHSLVGLYRGVPGRLRRVTGGGVTSAKVWSLARGRDGRVWVGRNGGLTLFHRGGTRTFDARDGLAGEMVIAVHEDRRRRLWAGTDAGLFRLDRGRFTAFTPAQGLASSFVLSIAEDSGGAVWVATNGGLSRVSPVGDSIGTFRVTDGLPNPIVTEIHATGGALWAATLGGLARIEGGRITSVRAEHGLPDDVVIALHEDDDDVWLATGKGVVRVPLAELNAVAGGRAAPARATTFDTRDGLRTVEVAAARAHPVVTKGPDGRLWFSTTAGIAVVDPRRLQRNSVAPRALVEEVAVAGKLLPQGTTREIPPQPGRLDIRYTAASLRVPERVRFRYKLEGFDSRWSDATARRDVSYTNLPPARYTFRVVAANDDGVWSEAAAGWSFRVLPAWYQTLWFRVTAAVLVSALGAAAAALVQRRRYLRAQAALRTQYEATLAERARIAQDLHDTLLQGFAGVTLQLKTAELALPEQPDVAAETILRVQRLARESLREARARVWDMREAAHGSDDLPNALEAVARERVAGTGIEVAVACTGARRRLAPPVEDAAFRIGREAVVNAVRHADARRVEIHVDFRSSRLRLEVRDDGRGFTPDETEQARRNGHFGLSGARERARHLGGTCDVRTRPGGGTVVAVELPLAGPVVRADPPNGVLPRVPEKVDLSA